MTNVRELKSPDGPVLILTKRTRFGTKMRSGKRGEEGAGSGKRFMPVRRTGGQIT